ncbi:toxin [Cellulomonas sp. RIT-PI-Y]|uniref:toxin n=1 Tax=Cellulomonas sp. RIT-PI-Y TaxID=3035297 RepID=UPI0021DAAD62|nr:toxin [Cellulomonas sp. RIT-PI-Y]
MTTTPWPPRRVRVVGTSGSGKTTYARALARTLDLPYRELDEVFWAADWTYREVEEARAELREFAAGPGWVVDGNWETARGGLLEDVDVLVWLDYPRRLVMSRVIRRTLRRTLTRQELWHGNREDWRFMFRRDPDENVILWAWQSHTVNRARYRDRQASGPVPVVRLRSPRAARAWLRELSRV